MGRRGQQKTPLSVLKLRGSWRGNLNANEPQPENALPDCPEWLSDGAKRIWCQLLPQLDYMGVLKKIDGNAFCRYCQMYDQWLIAQKSLQKYGFIMPIKNDKGTVIGYKDRPEVRRAFDLSKQITILEREFGLTPSARAGLIVERKDKDKKDKYVNIA